MSDIFLNGVLAGVCSEELAEAVGKYCNKIEAENAKLKELIGLHREQKLEKDVTSADRRLWDLALLEQNK